MAVDGCVIDSEISQIKVVQIRARSKYHEKKTYSVRRTEFQRGMFGLDNKVVSEAWCY